MKKHHFIPQVEEIGVLSFQCGIFGCRFHNNPHSANKVLEYLNDHF